MIHLSFKKKKITIIFIIFAPIKNINNYFMKKILFATLALCLGHIGFAQRGIYHEDQLSFGSNFLKNEYAMRQINLDLGIGYRFSEKFRLGFIVEFGHIAFHDERNEKARSFSTGFGLNGNFRFYTSEKIALHSQTHLLIGGPDKDALADWGFFRAGTEVQTYFLSLASERTKPYISLGVNAIYGNYEKDRVEIERTCFMPHIGIGIVTLF